MKPPKDEQDVERYVNELLYKFNQLSQEEIDCIDTINFSEDPCVYKQKKVGFFGWIDYKLFSEPVGQNLECEYSFDLDLDWTKANRSIYYKIISTIADVFNKKAPNAKHKIWRYDWTLKCD